MRNDVKSKIWTIVCLACIALPSVSMAGAIPPDPSNAALLYYQALLMMPDPEGQMPVDLAAVAKGEVPPDQARAFLEKCRSTIDFVEAAATLPQCDWGYRFSLGFDVQLPQLSQLRRLAFVLVSDARLRASDGTCRGALERCLLVDSVSRHVGDDTIISYLVSIAIRNIGRECMQEVIGQAAADAELLRWLKGELATAEPWGISPVHPLKIEVEVMTDLMRMNKRDKLIEAMTNPEDPDAKKVSDFVATLDAGTLERARSVYRKRMASILATMATPLPYAECYSRTQKLSNDFDPNDPALRVAGAFMPAMAKIYTLKVRCDARTDAIAAGIEICLHRAESGKLPAALPVGLPKDPYSGEDFEYERTDGGFVLRCRGKDLDKDMVYEFKFPVK